jgi:hypothetical protein
MRTTPRIEDGVFVGVKSPARREDRTLWEVIPGLGRQALQAPAPDAMANRASLALDDRPAKLGLAPYRSPDVAEGTQAQLEALREAEGL